MWFLALPGNARCTCGHREFAHEHYRPGSDCGVCACTLFHRRRWWRR